MAKEPRDSSKCPPRGHDAGIDSADLDNPANLKGAVARLQAKVDILEEEKFQIQRNADLTFSELFNS
jgi:hypothetical protein